MAKKEIKIAVDVRDHLPLEKLVPFQGALKDLSEKNFKKLRNQILKLGFSEAISVWSKAKDDGSYCIINGHQRVRTLTQMQDEGYEIPDLPVVMVHAKDFKEARKKVLAATSNFGEMTTQGLYEFMTDSDISMDEIAEFNFSEIKLDKFAEEFGDIPSTTAGSGDGSYTAIQHIENSQQHIVSVNCEGEQAMQELYEELKDRGYECKLIT